MRMAERRPVVRRGQAPVPGREWLRRSKADPYALQVFVARAKAARLKAFEFIDTVRRPNLARFERIVEANLQGAWQVEGGQLPSLRPPLDWAYSTRNNQIHLHSFGPVSALLAGRILSRRRDFLDLAWGYAADWMKSVQVPAFDVAPEVLIKSAGPNGNLAWINAAPGLRLQRLAFLFDAACRDPKCPLDQLALYFDSIHYHIELLSLPGVGGLSGSHALFQALGLLAVCGRFPWHQPFARRMAEAQKALTLALNAQFTPDGAHSEHSPAFHMSTLNALLGARSAGLVEDNAAALLLIALAEEAASAMLQPDGRLAAFGDTDSTILPDYGKGDRFRHPGLIYTLSHGRSGTPPASEVRAFPDAGYAFARLHDGDAAKATYLAQMGSFNSRAHKHADHLSFIWAEGPMTILGDPGRYGYRGATKPGSDLHQKGFYYNDPKRIYVESTHSHNCVEIDGESHSRNLEHTYGSAFQQADIQDGLVVFDFDVNHPKAVRQIRTLILCPNQYLLVVDWLQSEVGRPHDFRQWFKLAPEWTDAAVEGVEMAAFCGLRTLCATELLGSSASQIWRGAEKPLRGWFSTKPGELEPAMSFNFSRLNTAEAAFATVFMLDGWIEAEAATKVETFAEAATFAFTAGERLVQIDYRREEKVTVKRTVR